MKNESANSYFAPPRDVKRRLAEQRLDHASQDLEILRREAHPEDAELLIDIEQKRDRIRNGLNKIYGETIEIEETQD